jgi:hypothetical protein
MSRYHIRILLRQGDHLISSRSSRHGASSLHRRSPTGNPIAFERFHNQLPELLLEGSPIRKTDRAGARGTRLVEGFNEADLKIELYYDSVC